MINDGTSGCSYSKLASRRAHAGVGRINTNGVGKHENEEKNKTYLLPAEMVSSNYESCTYWFLINLHIGL